ncbi:unnamed protein product [Bursaphelenchus xylophilus]|uniref:(pine wood nematode) hypothetical protein n=1 Tax=Bursaphelenchus xylophilus TaxID=6326 RepID=A0A1I7SB70_BURXY|nr:unnamed protein product [Bursaphelenchus xylophilus]CAG9118706.1 unnamed protein product [Bursaphelenchus xylophilus]
MIVPAKVSIVHPEKPKSKPIGPAKCALNFDTKQKRGKLLVMKIRCATNQRLECINEITEGNCSLINPKDPSKLTFSFLRPLQHVLLSTLTAINKENILFVVDHFLHSKHNSQEDLLKIKRLFCNAHNPTTVAKVLASDGPKKLELRGEAAKADSKQRKSYPKSIENLVIEGEIPLDLRPFALKNLTTLRLKVAMSAETSKDMLYLMNLSRLTKLEELDLSDNGLTDLPDKVYRSFPKSLRVLNLSKNSLKTLPESLDHLTEIIKLDVSHNEIKKIGETFYKWTKLRDLRLDHNQISFIPKTLVERKRFEVITVYENNIMPRGSGIVKIPMDDVYQLQVFSIIKLMNMGLKPEQIFPPAWNVKFFAHTCFSCHKYIFEGLYLENYIDIATISQSVITGGGYHGHHLWAYGYCCNSCYRGPAENQKSDRYLF